MTPPSPPNPLPPTPRSSPQDKKADLRNKERELQDLEEKHQVEIKIYKQRVKHLLYEQQNEITTAKTDSETSLKLSQDQHRSEEFELKTDKRGLKLELKEMELSHDDYLKSLKRQQDRNITLLRQEFERKSSEMHKNFDKKMKNIRDNLDARRKDFSMAIEERKNSHIKQLMKAHEQEFSEIKNYYNDITHNNFDKKMKNIRDNLDARRKDFSMAIEERKNSHIKQLMKAHEQEFSEIKNYYNDITHNNLDLIKSLKDEGE